MKIIQRLENGVGMIRLMQDEFDEAVSDLSDFDLSRRRDISVATGEGAFDFISGLVEALKRRLES